MYRSETYDVCRYKENVAMTSIPYSRESWLNQHGGRDNSHIKVDENGVYVEMYSPIENTGLEKVYIPQHIEDSHNEYGN